MLSVSIELRPPFDHLTFMAPLSEQRAERLIRFLATDLVGTVLDLGCGWAELLLRTLEAAPAAHGIGIDSDPASIAHGESAARERGLAERVRFIVGDARTTAPDRADAAICIGASQIWQESVGATDDPPSIDYAAALRALRALVPRGARVVYGEGIWSQAPTPAAAAPLAGRLDEFVTLAELTELAAGHGFMPVAVHEANLDEWDEFESGFSARYAAWIAEHSPDDPDADDVQRRADRQRAGYLSGYRGVLGLAYLALIAV
jgi:SAM-dependent methyltransferase